MTVSIRARLLITLLALATSVSLLAGWLTHRQVLAETSTLFDYQLRQMALSLRNQVTLAPRIEIPPDQGDADYVVQIWDIFGARVYRSRPGLPVIDRPIVGFEDLEYQGQPWRMYGQRTLDGVIQVAQPVRVREEFARASALRVVVPVLLLIPILGIAIIMVVRSGLVPLRRAAAEVQRRDVNSLAPLDTTRLPAEIAPLVQELNRLLARVDNAFLAQRAFIADAAHELRSPLTAVLLQLQLLDRAPDEAAAREARLQLGAAIDRATHLLGQLLTLARNEPRDAPEELRPITLEQPTADALADTHALAQSREIELELKADPDARVMGDHAALRTLVRNLVDNAVRYTPEHGKVLVRVSHASQGTTLEVTDSGPGIPEADRARAFDRFYRRSASPAGGSGLGLAIVKAIAERHSATVKLDDAPGGGLRVTVAFPPPP
jgi:two-component system OmpR family sensor kinase/two-component system sensor histidine kinase QseC